LLANEVEQAARGLENPTPSRIKGLVHRVVQDNLESWNLDDSGLSLSDIARVRDSFVPILAAAFRGRVQSDRGSDDANFREKPSRRGSDPRGRR
jgi:membrane-associated HD superfamily phosphohydrolase